MSASTSSEFTHLSSDTTRGKRRFSGRALDSKYSIEDGAALETDLGGEVKRAPRLDELDKEPDD